MSRLKTDAIRNVNASVDGINLDTSGNVGLGTTSPNTKLHVEGTGTIAEFKSTNNNYLLQLKGNNSANYVYLGTTSSNDYLIANNTNGSGFAERLRITSDGRIGVGTSPHSSYRFDIRHTSNAYLHLGQGDATLGAMANNTWNALSFQGTNAELGLFKDSSGNYSYIMGTYQGGTAIPVVFRTGNRVERLRINSGGQVLIGTSSDPAFTNRRLTVATSSGTTAIEIRSAEAGDGRIIFTDSTSSGSPGSYKGQILYDQSNDYMSFNTNGNNERLRITSAGKLWVATTTDNTDAPVVARCSAGYSFAAIKDNTAPSIVFGGVTQPRVLLEARHNANTLQFHTATGSTYASAGWTNRMEIESNGNVKITDGNLYIGTAGHGIDFSADGNASGADDELLNDYEEGDWTPTPIITHQGGSGSLSSIQDQYGRYVKIGREVRVWFYFKFTAANITNCNVGVSGLPFTVSNDAQWNNSFHGGIARRGITGGETYICEGMYKNNTQITVLRKYDNYGFTNTTQSVGGTACYLVD